MGTALTILGIVLALIFGLVAREEIIRFFKGFSKLPYISIFGPKKAGKSSLFTYLTGQPVSPDYNETFTTEAVGKITFDISGKRSAYIKTQVLYDVPGEFLNKWRPIIKKCNPDGIIFIVDKTNFENEKQSLNYIFDCYNEIYGDEINPHINLKVFYFFINKADEWASSATDKDKEAEKYFSMIKTEVLDKRRKVLPSSVKYLYGWTSLIDETCFEHTNNLIRDFAILSKR